VENLNFHHNLVPFCKNSMRRWRCCYIRWCRKIMWPKCWVEWCNRNRSRLRR
jgi:hypothetical protein